MTRITKIFLDLDDVLNDFTLSALEHVGCKVGPRDFHLYDPEWGFDIVRAANSLLFPTKFRFSAYTFWQMLDRTFWETVPMSKEADWLLNVCEALVGRKNVCILTAPTLETYVPSAKAKWIYDNLPTWLHKQFLIGPCKYMCASSEALLIDDSDANVQAFRRAGGKALLYPRPWNSLHDLHPVQYIQSTLATLFPHMEWVPLRFLRGAA